MDRFSKLNPRTTFLFFMFQIILSLLLFHPIYLAVSFVSAFLYRLKLTGREALKSFFRLAFPLIIFVPLFNFAFAHYGATVIFSLKDTVFTLESLFYGLCQGVMLASVIMWFSSYSQVVTSERVLAVFGRLVPNTALVFSMVMSFLPRLRKNAEEIQCARKLIDKEKSKLRKGIDNLSALITMTLEESIEVAGSMKARGFSSARVPYSKYVFRIKDGFIIALFSISFLFLVIMKTTGRLSFIYEPVIIMKSFSLISLLIYILFSLLPLIIDLLEDIRWFYLKQKI